VNKRIANKLKSEVEEILNTLNEKQLSTAIDDLAEAFNSYLF